jgi:alanine racemase
MEEENIWRPTYARIDLDNIRHNVRLFTGLVGPDCQVMAVVKADGYGHGARETAKAALQAGAVRLGVALVEEGEDMRLAGFEVPVHLLFEPPPTAAAKVVELELTPTVYTLEYAEALSEAAVEAGTVLPIHVKIDTGMHRVGMEADRALEMTESISALPGLEMEGIYTHLAMASEPRDPFTLKQLKVFDEIYRRLEERGLRIPLRHAAASGAALSHPGARMDMIRLGISMYGLLPGPDFKGQAHLRPALSLHTRISRVFRVPAGEGLSYGLTHTFTNPSWVAVLPVGYGDGFARALSNRWKVSIGGKLYDLVGTICMDVCMVDLRDDRLAVGEDVVVIGGNGEEEIGVELMAEVLGTINYEVVCDIGKRVPRIYENDM